MHLVQLSQKLAHLIATRNLTQESLGDALGIAHTTVGRWLAGKSRPYPRVAHRLADYFGVSVEMLVNDKLALPLPTDQEVIAAMDIPAQPAMARMLRENLARGVGKLAESSAGMPPGSTLADLLQIETRLHELCRDVARLRKRIEEKEP